MGRKPKVIDIDSECQRMIDELRSRIGQSVPLSCRYTRGERPILVGITKDRAALKYANGTTVLNVPLRDLVDDAAYWRT